jgi:ubiquinone/menaquinone biosynthesis C-methylase UbiE
MTREHASLVTNQFGGRAEAYVTSAVHASGEDLAQIASLAQARRPKRALDLGCGGGHVSFHLAPHAGEVVAYDLSAEMLGAVAGTASARGLGNIRTQQGAVEKPPFADGAFDFVASRFSAHHWHDVPKALREARRVLTKTGRAVFADTASPGEPLCDTWLQAIELLRDPSHVRDYTAAEWAQMLRDAGFAPAVPTFRRLRLDFASWIARMATPETNARAIRALQAVMPKEAAVHFAVEADGSFTLDTFVVEALPI